MCSICGCEAWNKYIIGMLLIEGCGMYVCIFTFYFALFRNDYMEDRGAGVSIGCGQVMGVWSIIGRCGQDIVV